MSDFLGYLVDPFLWNGLWVAIQITVVSMVLALILGLVLALMRESRSAALCRGRRAGAAAAYRA
jgi:polar amino acid transport system permease protein